jgi:hypothetical protein
LDLGKEGSQKVRESIMTIARKTMTLNLTEAEMKALDDLSAQKDISKTAVLRQALRLYQMLDARLARGEKLFFEHDTTKEKAELMLV